jgi:hypothetical protein
MPWLIFSRCPRSINAPIASLSSETGKPSVIANAAMAPPNSIGRDGFRADHHCVNIVRSAAVALVGVFWVHADERGLQRQARRLLGGGLA